MLTKGIILAGGAGTRLGDITKVVSKQLLPIYDKPLIYYSLSTLISIGVKEILIISTPEAIVDYKKLIGDSINGIRICYEIQTAPNGIAEAYLIGEQFIDKHPSALILGDNIFYGADIRYAKTRRASSIYAGCIVFAYSVADPSRYGVIELDDESFNGFYSIKSIQEKPSIPKSQWAVPGLYIFDSNACEYAKKLKPSARNELEITDLINEYIKMNTAYAYKLPDEFCWFDAGTHESMLEASNFVAAVQRRTGKKFGCPYSLV